MDEVKIKFTESEVNSDNISGVLISEDAAESLVRCFLPDIVSFFESEQGRKEFEFKQRNTIEERISNIFINVGIPPHIKGYSFLREAVKMAIEKPEMVNNITKQLYPSIAQRFATTASKVERAIRHAIEVAWSRGRIESINNILGVRAFVGKEKPTNGEFIALVADKMLLERA